MSDEKAVSVSANESIGLSGHSGGGITFTAGKGWAEPGGKQWPNGVIKFCIGDTEILVIDDDGIVYKSQRAQDAGEAHRVVLEFFNKHFVNPA